VAIPESQSTPREPISTSVLSLARASVQTSSAGSTCCPAQLPARPRLPVAHHSPPRCAATQSSKPTARLSARRLCPPAKLYRAPPSRPPAPHPQYSDHHRAFCGRGMEARPIHGSQRQERLGHLLPTRKPLPLPRLKRPPSALAGQYLSHACCPQLRGALPQSRQGSPP
jgi:hypothetical protein